MTGGTAPRLDFRIVASAPALRVRIDGDLDVYTADSLVDHVVVQLPQDPVLVLDLGGVGFCDSYGVRALIGIRQHCERTGQTLQVVGPNPVVRRLLVDTLGLGDYLRVQADAG